jgi:hypothetical protein
MDEQDARQGKHSDRKHEREPGLEARAEQEEEADRVAAPDERARKDSRRSPDRRCGEDEHCCHAKGKDEQQGVHVLGELACGDRVDLAVGELDARGQHRAGSERREEQCDGTMPATSWMFESSTFTRCALLSTHMRSATRNQMNAIPANGPT